MEYDFVRFLKLWLFDFVVVSSIFYFLLIIIVINIIIIIFIESNFILFYFFHFVCCFTLLCFILLLLLVLVLVLVNVIVIVAVVFVVVIVIIFADAKIIYYNEYELKKTLWFQREELLGVAFNRIMRMEPNTGDHIKTWRYNTMKVRNCLNAGKKCCVALFGHIFFVIICLITEYNKELWSIRIRTL